MNKTQEHITALYHPSSSSHDDIDDDNEPISYEDVDLMLDPQESAKFSIALAFTLSTLYYILLNSKGKSKGDDGEKHPINAEISRIRQYVARMNQQQTSSSSSSSKSEEKQRIQHTDVVVEVSAVDVPTLQINKEAAQRMIKHNISSAPTQKHTKKQKLRK